MKEKPIEELYFLAKQQLELGYFYSARRTLNKLIETLEAKK